MQALTVAGNLDSLEIVGRYVLEAAAEAGLDKRASYRLRLAIDEVVTNIITHGYEEAGLDGEVFLHCALDEHALTVIVEDTAQPFDPRARPEPDNLDSPLEERDIGGLGVYLALNGVDAYNYEYVGRRNRSSFTMNRPTQA